MEIKYKLAALELLGGIFGWVSIVAGIAALYFFVVAIGSDGQWSSFFWAFGIFVVSKSLLRGFLAIQYRAQNEAGLVELDDSSYDFKDVQSALEVAEKIVQSYGAVMIEAEKKRGIVHDISLLPDSKENIKAAILLSLKLADDPQDINALTTGYIGLSDFQDGIGVHAVVFDISDFPSSDEYLKRYDESKKWCELQMEERKSLQLDLAEAGF